MPPVRREPARPKRRVRRPGEGTTMRVATKLFVTVAVGALATPAFAQEGAGTPMTTAAEDASVASGGVTDIVVTARRRSENIQNVPLSVTGISAATLSRQNITSIDRLDGLAPSLSIRP